MRRASISITIPKTQIKTWPTINVSWIRTGHHRHKSFIIMIHELTTAFSIAAISQFVKSVENILRHFYWALDAVVRHPPEPRMKILLLVKWISHSIRCNAFIIARIKKSRNGYVFRSLGVHRHLIWGDVTLIALTWLSCCSAVIATNGARSTRCARACVSMQPNNSQMNECCVYAIC